MTPSLYAKVVEPTQYETTKNGLVTEVKLVTPPSESENLKLPKPEQMPPRVFTNGNDNDLHTPQSIDPLDYDDPVVIVGMGEWRLMLCLRRARPKFPIVLEG